MKELIKQTELRLEEIKQLEMGILLAFDSLCKKHSIKYSLYAGTLLGAVRHQGFIPWDDDIDVVVDRENYNKLLEVENQLDERYKFMSIEKTKNYSTPLAKVIDITTILNQHARDRVQLGVYIDVFVLDDVPTNKVKKNILFSLIDFNIRLWSLAVNYPRSNNFIEKSIRKMAYFFRLDRMATKVICRICKKERVGATQKGNLAFSGYGENKEICPANIIDETTLLSFENSQLPAFKDYETYLTVTYGDYMQLPPEDKRISNHTFEAYKIEHNT